jgi:hypothetical protein
MFQTKVPSFVIAPLFSHLAIAVTHATNGSEFKTYVAIMKGEVPSSNSKTGELLFV